VIGRFNLGKQDLYGIMLKLLQNVCESKYWT